MARGASTGPVLSFVEVLSEPGRVSEPLLLDLAVLDEEVDAGV